MSQVQNSSVAANHGAGETELSVIDLLIVLARHKKLIIGLPLAAAVISAGVSMALPASYKATAKLLPPQQAQSGASALLAQFGGVASMAAGVAGIKNPSDLYVGMLKSRTVADRLIAQYDLKKVYQTGSDEKARARLEKSTVISSGKDGFITIEVEDSDKKMVPRLTNSYVEELLRLTRTLAVTEAAQRRLFFERQLELAKTNLSKAEVSLKGAIESRGVVSVDVESRAVMETLARLRAQVSAKEIELNSMRAFVTPSHSSYRRAEEELSSLRAALFKLENGRAGQDSEQDQGQTPARQGGLESIQRLRDLKYYQMLYELLAKQYEAARLDEARDAPIVQVLDPAVEPENRSKPRRSMIVLLSTVGALFLAMVAAFGMEAKSKAVAHPSGARRWNELKTGLRFK
jgi:uncharacterized protein involved in exopolysaccharide biosynthesis